MENIIIYKTNKSFIKIFKEHLVPTCEQSCNVVYYHYDIHVWYVNYSPLAWFALYVFTYTVRVRERYYIRLVHEKYVYCIKVKSNAIPPQ